MSYLDDLEALEPKAIWDGVVARIVEGERITMAVVELEPGRVVPEHRHENEQLGLLLEGSLTFTVGGQTREVRPGGTWRIPAGAPHSAEAGPDGAVAVDVFSPPRADWAEIRTEAARPARWPA